MGVIKILIVATSHAHMGETNRKTGLWLEELAVPYYIFKDVGAVLTLASPKGGQIPLDPKSESIIASNSTIIRFNKDSEAISWLAHSLPLIGQKAEDFDLVFLLGGHGTMWDFTGNVQLKQLLEDFNRQNKIIGAVCHGVVGLITLKNSMGEPLVKGRKLTAFSNSEENASGMSSGLPFSLETELLSLGAAYTKGADFVSHIVVDGNLITGQNPASAKEVAKELLVRQKDAPKRIEVMIPDPVGNILN